MTIIRTGATKKYASGWDRAFGKAEKKAKAGPAATKSRAKTRPVAAVAKKKKKVARKVKSQGT